MFRKIAIIVAAILIAAAGARADLPVKIVNSSRGDFADSDIYVAIIGQIESGHIYYDLGESSRQHTAAIKTLNESCNTLHHKEGDWGYANVFTRLSDIQDKTVYLGNTHACRMFVSFGSPMFLHAFPNGYAGADMNNPGDPNADIRWELIEFTYEPSSLGGVGQIWINTTRVDAYQYPMGLELYSAGNVSGSTAYIKRGESLTHQQIIDRWNNTLGNTVYKDCCYNLIKKDNLAGIIKQPSKVESIKKSGIFDDYINRVWDYFSTHTANISMGVLGRWEGGVVGDQFVITCKDGHYWPLGSQGHIGKPSTEDAIEGAGPFASGSDIDKTVQAMFCAAFNRGQFRLTTDNQNWDPATGINPFTGGSEYPCNEYVKFFHDPSVSVSSGYTYAFAYDDTFDQSATCYSTAPQSATVTIGGFADGTTPPDNPEKPDKPSDIPAAPAPGVDASKVKSFFSGAYPTVVPGMFVGTWGQSTRGSIESCSGDDAYKFTDFNYVGLQFSSDDATVDVSDMTTLHLDLYAPETMDINIVPISLGPTIEAGVSRHLDGGKWTSLDIALSEFGNVDFTRFGQLKLDGGNGQTFYLDNFYTWTSGQPTNPDNPDNMPTAPVPATRPEKVKSFFSDAYETVTPDLVVGSWGQSTRADIVSIDGDNAYCLTNFNYLGLQVSAQNDMVDISDRQYLHIDLYATMPATVEFYPISFNDAGVGVDTDKKTVTLEKGKWQSFDFPMGDFPSINYARFAQFKLVNVTPATSSSAIRVAPVGNAVYLDNLYSWGDGTLGIENVAADTVESDVYDLHGRFVRKGASVSGLRPGIYIVGGRKVAVTR